MNITEKGRLLLFEFKDELQPVVLGSGYLVRESAGGVLYVVTLWERQASPPQRWLHLVMVRLLKAVSADAAGPVLTHLQPIKSRMLLLSLREGFVSTLAPITLSALEEKLKQPTA